MWAKHGEYSSKFTRAKALWDTTPVDKKTHGVLQMFHDNLYALERNVWEDINLEHVDARGNKIPAKQRVMDRK